ncbi:MAG: hypothetical protein HY776_02210 [Actinobacteria bacterium]|nr:hypothetical protein [Actinomycetota bacterium]
MQAARKARVYSPHIFEKPSFKIAKRKHRSSNKTNYFSRFMVTLVMLTIAVTINISQHALIAQHAIRSDELKTVLQNEQVKNEKLQMQVDSMKSPERMKKIAIEKLGMVKPMEINYIKYFNQKINSKKLQMPHLLQNNSTEKKSFLSTIYNQILEKLNKIFETDFNAQAKTR